MTDPIGLDEQNNNTLLCTFLCRLLRDHNVKSPHFAFGLGTWTQGKDFLIKNIYIQYFRIQLQKNLPNIWQTERHLDNSGEFWNCVNSLFNRRFRPRRRCLSSQNFKSPCLLYRWDPLFSRFSNLDYSQPRHDKLRVVSCPSLILAHAKSARWNVLNLGI